MPLSSMDVKRLNRILLYRAVLREDAISRNELSARLGLSLPTVAQSVKDLLDKGLVRETGTLASTGGRKAGVVSPLVDAKISLGVDVTRNHASLAAVNLRGEPKAHKRTQMKFVNSPEYFAAAGSLVRDFLERNEISADVLIGMGISLPGIVAEDGETLLNSHMLNIREPHRMAVRLERDLPTRLFNDASAACLAELWGDAGAGNFFFLSLSNSVGGAWASPERSSPATTKDAGR